MKNARSLATTHLEVNGLRQLFFVFLGEASKERERGCRAKARGLVSATAHISPGRTFIFEWTKMRSSKIPSSALAVPIAAPGATRSTLKMRMRAGASCAKEERGPRSWSDRPRETRSHTRALTRFQRCPRCPSSLGKPDQPQTGWLAMQRLQRGARCSVDGRSPGRINRSNPESGSSRKAAGPAICQRQMKKRENGSPFDEGEAD
jgi:hypothetical protein